MVGISGCKKSSGKLQGEGGGMGSGKEKAGWAQLCGSERAGC